MPRSLRLRLSSLRPLSLRPLSLLAGLVLLAVGVSACSDEEPYPRVDPGEPIERDLSDILERDTLVVLTMFNSTGYFLYRGEPMGYEYELLRDFAEEHEVVMRTVVVPNRDSLFYLLNQGMGDVAAARIVPMDVEQAGVQFTEGLYRTRPAVVQRDTTLAAADLPDTVDSLLGEEAPRTLVEDSVEISARLITQPDQLADQEVTLPGGSPYYETLVELEDTLSGDIEIVQLAGDVSSEAIIRQIARGEVALTVSQSNLAKLKESYYTNIVVTPTIAQPHEVAWAVRANSPQLQEALNGYIRDPANDAAFQNIYEKYYVDRRGYQERQADDYLSSETGRLSPYDGLFQTYAPDVEWDWRLLASQSFQESRFRPRARSWAGAQGLLQLMPATAREFGVANAYDPDENVAGAVRFLEWLQNYWDDKIEDPNERLKFILASYNTGHGHVEDARRLTEKYGDDPNLWGDVAYWLLQKSKKKYYRDPVVRYGYARGLEPVTYVSRILDRYEHYRQLVTVDADSTAVTPEA